MKRAIEGNAMATSMLQDLGKIYFHDGQYEKAMEALSASSSEKDPEGKLYLGRTQMELGRIARPEIPSRIWCATMRTIPRPTII
jgi:uncharacterized protein HemY